MTTVKAFSVRCHMVLTNHSGKVIDWRYADPVEEGMGGEPVSW